MSTKKQIAKLIEEFDGQRVGNQIIARVNNKNVAAANRVAGEWHITADMEVKLGIRQDPTAESDEEEAAEPAPETGKKAGK